MKKLFLIGVLCLFLLVACGEEELPPSPPAPGGEVSAGQAVGGIAITQQLPSWAAQIKHADISPTLVKQGDTLVVTVEKPSSLDQVFYVHAVAYAFNKKFRFWEKAFADASASGQIVQQWAKNKGVFKIPVSADRFTAGPNYVVVYWCIDTDERDEQGFKIWDCNNKKWGLGAFEMSSAAYTELIERDIENNRYKSSIKQSHAFGDLFTASYTHLSGYNVDVSVLKLSNVNSWKTELAKSTSTLQNQWGTRGTVCGFLSTGTGFTQFSWLSGSYWLTVKTFSTIVDDAKVGIYGIKYASDCNLLTSLTSLTPPSACGNSQVDSGEDCDKTADTACPGACRPDCSCASTGSPNLGFCGDLIIQRPNLQGVVEDCEPPGSRNPVTGQLTSTGCFLRNAQMQITGVGACDNTCKCIAQTAYNPSTCGDGNVDSGEQCGEPTLGACPAGQACLNCKCSGIPPACGNGAADAGEQCDPGNPGVACANPNDKCGVNCLCGSNPKSKCGDGRITPPENCEKHSDCPGGGVCMGCNCVWFIPPWQPGPWINFNICGDGVKQAGEECETNQHCANPPGGILSPNCDKSTCACLRLCGDGRVDSPNQDSPPKNEQCDPPGSACTLAGGGAGVCNINCGCGPSTCGDGIPVSPEQCDPPGSPSCPCIIGANGEIACGVCGNTCDCPAGAEKRAPGGGCPGKDCGDPVDGIIIGSAPYTGFGFGTHFTQFDKVWPGEVQGECWSGCARGILDVGGGVVGTAPSQPVTCVKVEGVASSTDSSGNVQKTYTVSTAKSSCAGDTILNVPQYQSFGSVTMPGTGWGSESQTIQLRSCVSYPVTCPSNTKCQSTAEGAACVAQLTSDTVSGGGVASQGDVAHTGSVVVGRAVSMPAKGGVDNTQLAVFLIAAFGILVVTLLNFVHRD